MAGIFSSSYVFLEKVVKIVVLLMVVMMMLTVFGTTTGIILITIGAIAYAVHRRRKYTKTMRERKKLVESLRKGKVPTSISMRKWHDIYAVDVAGKTFASDKEHIDVMADEISECLLTLTKTGDYPEGVFLTEAVADACTTYGGDYEFVWKMARHDIYEDVEDLMNKGYAYENRYSDEWAETIQMHQKLRKMQLVKQGEMYHKSVIRRVVEDIDDVVQELLINKKEVMI